MNERIVNFLKAIERMLDNSFIGKWALSRWSETLRKRFVEAFKALPPGVFWNWLKPLLYGVLVTGAVSIVLVYIVRYLDESGQIAYEDVWLERFVNASPVSVMLSIWFNVPGHPLYLFTLAAIAAVIAINARAPLQALLILLSYPLASVPVVTGWSLWDRARPEVLLDGALAPGFHSFPSGHTVQTIVVYSLFAYFWIRRTDRIGEKLLAVLGVVAIVGITILGRLLISAHHPSDILAGIVLAFLWLPFIINSVRAIPYDRPTQPVAQEPIAAHPLETSVKAS